MAEHRVRSSLQYYYMSSSPLRLEFGPCCDSLANLAGMLWRRSVRRFVLFHTATRAPLDRWRLANTLAGMRHAVRYCLTSFVMSFCDVFLAPSPHATFMYARASAGHAPLCQTRIYTGCCRRVCARTWPRTPGFTAPGWRAPRSDSEIDGLSSVCCVLRCCEVHRKHSVRLTPRVCSVGLPPLAARHKPADTQMGAGLNGRVLIGWPLERAELPGLPAADTPIGEHLLV